MIDRVGQGGGLARAAIEAALKAQADAALEIREQVARALTSPAQEGRAAPSFPRSLESVLGSGLRAADAGVASVERLPVAMVQGEVQAFHEIAARLKQAELTFKFALEVRNKLIDAYRETMRMSV